MSQQLFFVEDKVKIAQNPTKLGCLITQQIYLHGGQVIVEEIPNLGHIISNHPENKKIPPELWADFVKSHELPFNQSLSLKDTNNFGNSRFTAINASVNTL